MNLTLPEPEKPEDTLKRLDERRRWQINSAWKYANHYRRSLKPGRPDKRRYAGALVRWATNKKQNPKPLAGDFCLQTLAAQIIEDDVLSFFKYE